MPTVEKTPAIDPEVLADLEAVCNTKGIVRDPKLLRRITERADQVRQETLKKQPFQHATSCIIMGAGNGLRLSTSPRQGCINHYVLARVLAPTPMPTPTLAAPRISTDSRHSSLSDASN